MTRFPGLSAAWRQMRDVARVAGVSLADAVAGGTLSRGRAAAMVDRCAACRHSATCGLFLAVTAAAPVPAYCPNKHEIEALAASDP